MNGFWWRRFFGHKDACIGRTIWISNADNYKLDPLDAIATLAHEAAHLDKKKRWTPLLFHAAYWFPQWLGLLFLPLAITLFCSGFLGLAHVFVVLVVVAAFPWPAPGRVHIELDAYQLTFLARAFTSQASPKVIPQRCKDSVFEALSGKPYYWAAWDRKALEDRFYADGYALRRNDALEQAMLNALKEVSDDL